LFFINSFIHSLYSTSDNNADETTIRIHALYNTIKWIKRHYGIMDCCNYLKFSLLSDLSAVRLPRSLIATECTKIYIGILDLNILTLFVVA